MSMNKTEQAHMATLEHALRLARALHWPTYAEPAPMTREEIEAAKVPGGCRRYTSEPQRVALGWFGGTYDGGNVRNGCSDGINHGDGNTTTTQGMGRLFRTEAEAWRFVRMELTRQYAERLAKIDAKLQELEP